MKKTRLLISAVVLSGMVTAGSLPAMAEEAVNTEEGTATVQFTENTEKPGIVDPTNPEEPLVPQVPVDDPDNEGTDNPGPLSLDVFPARFDFGDDNMVNMMGHELESRLTGIHYLQITDNRSDTHGWNVSVSRTEFVDKSAEVAPATGGERTLAATLTLPIGVARNSMIGSTPTDTLSHSDAEFEIPVDSEESGAVPIISADASGTNGKATSTYVWNAGEEKLSVGKGESKTGNFESTINWTLSATPGQ